MEPDKIKLMRGASYLLPDPGGEVVRELLDEIERLQGELAGATAAADQLQHDVYNLLDQLP